jgi:multiple sugar transport system permease protein
MKRRSFTAAVAGTAVLLSAAWLTVMAGRDTREAERQLMATATRVAEELRKQTGFRMAVPGHAVRTFSPADLPPAIFEELRASEAPRRYGNGVIAPLKDSDDWDVVGAVEVVRRGGAVRRSLLRPSTTLPLGLLAVVAAALVRWGRRVGTLRRRDTLVAWSFLGVPMLHLAVFSFAPVLFTLLLSVHRWDLVSSARPFVGLANYRELAGDPLFWKTLGNTALYVLYVPVTMACALGLALLLNQRRRGERLLRAVVFLPYVTSTVAIALVWQWLMNADFGLVNFGLRLVGLPAVDWLGNPSTALLAIIAVTVWTQVGYQMIVLLAGLQGVPQQYLDAALVDGATPLRRLWHVTLPLLKPVLLFVLVTGVISGFQVFTLVYLMTEGGPLHATDVIVYRIYQTAWEFLRFGSASAMAVVLFAILLAVTVVQFRLLGRRIEHV